MKEARLPLPELGLIAATRGMLGAGIALLAGNKMEPGTRRTVGWALFLIGALSTIPLAIDVARNRQVVWEPVGRYDEMPQSEPVTLS